MKISEAIKFIVEKNDKKLLTDSKRFKAHLLDLCSDNPKELKIVKRALEDKVLERIFGNERDNVKIARLRDEFEDQGMTTDWSEFIISSFAEALGWNYTPKQTKQQIQQPIQNTQDNNKLVRKKAQKQQIQSQQTKQTEKQSLNQTDWTCSCGTVNNGNFCGNCGKSKPIPKTKNWICLCGTVNKTKFCGNCGKPNGQQQFEEEARKFKNFLLEVINGTQKGQTFDLESDKITIGRSLAPRERKRDWILIKDPSLARIHAFLEWDSEKRLYKAILKATNKNLIINGEFVNEGYLYHSDKLQLGDIIFRIWDRKLNKSFIEENNPIQKFETVFEHSNSKDINILPENIKDINIKSLVREVDTFSLRNAQVADYIKFGNYPQTANGGIKLIEWQVLAKENNKMLVISKYGLDCKRFDSSSNNWKNSEIRQWLNGEFYNKAFNGNEKKLIKNSSISTTVYEMKKKSGFWESLLGEEETVESIELTKDYIFLLSKEDIEKKFANKDARKCKATEYAVKNGAYVYDDNGCSCWWLRSPHPHNSSILYDVSDDGSIGGYSLVHNDDYVVRPALWINI